MTTQPEPLTPASIAARARADLAMPPCADRRCAHPFMEHTGRSIGFWDKEPRRGSACEHLVDVHHTCPCPSYYEETIR